MFTQVQSRSPFVMFEGEGLFSKNYSSSRRTDQFGPLIDYLLQENTKMQQTARQVYLSSQNTDEKCRCWSIDRDDLLEIFRGKTCPGPSGNTCMILDGYFSSQK